MTAVQKDSVAYAEIVSTALRRLESVTIFYYKPLAIMMSYHHDSMVFSIGLIDPNK